MSTTARPQARPTASETLLSAIHELGPVMAERAARHDAEGSFVVENYEALDRIGAFAAAVPVELGGGGLSHRDTCELLRALAHACPSTALALSMHQHTVAAAVYRYRRGLPGEALLRKVVDGAILVTTGGRDWLESNGEATRVEGGYRVSARKAFASGSPAGDLVVTSAPYDDPDAGARVLHFTLPIRSEGIRLENDWDALGMRGTGSRTLVMDELFVPDDAVALTRPRGVWHPAWGVVVGVAQPLILSVYLGAAEAAAGRALAAAGRKRDPGTPYLIGEMTNLLTTARLAVTDTVARVDDYAFEPSVAQTDAVLVRKTIASRALVATCEKALELAGGVGFFRSFGLERLLRDVHAAQFHPLPEKQQQLFTGRVALGLEPVQGTA